MNRMEYPARVGHAVTHSSTSGTLALAAGGLIIGVIIVLATAPETVTVAAVATAATAATEATEAVVATEAAASTVAATGAAISTVASYGKAGMTVGKWIDTFLAPSVSGHIIHGLDTVLLGPSVLPAARAEPSDTFADCAGAGKGFEGSATVFLGRENKPMSRREDRLHCAGVISEGEPSIIVGGAPSHEGESIEEADSDAVKDVGLGLDIASLANPFFGTERSAFQAAMGSGQVIAEATGHDKVSDVLGVPTSVPTSPIEWFNSTNDAFKAGSSASKLGSGSSGGSE